MPTYLLTRRGNGSHSRFGSLSSLPSVLHIPLGDTQPEGGDTFSHDVHSHDQSESSLQEVDHPFPADLGTLVDFASRLQPFLLPDYRLLGQGDIRIIGTRPIDAGGFADVWVGEMGDRKVAVKSYRCYASANYMPTYKRFCHEVLVCTRLSDHHIVPFIGVYSTREHPFSLVFEFMEHLNLGEYLRNNRDVGKLELLLGIARAVKDMHDLNVIHGNLEIANILVDAGGRVRIAGLGEVSIPSAMPGVDVDRFSHNAAPELFNSRCFGFVGTESTKTSDTYAFGIIAWEVFAGRVPFSDKNKVAGTYLMLKGRRPGRPDHPDLSDPLWKLIKGCWEGDPARCKTISEVVTVLEAELLKAK